MIIPDHIVRQFREGDCMWLAQAMHRRFGWPIHARMFKDGDIDFVGHAYCVMPDGREIDILGPQEKIDLFAEGKVRVWEADELLATMTHNRIEALVKLSDADSIIDTYIVPNL